MPKTLIDSGPMRAQIAQERAQPPANARDPGRELLRHIDHGNEVLEAPGTDAQKLRRLAEYLASLGTVLAENDLFDALARPEDTSRTTLLSLMRTADADAIAGELSRVHAGPDGDAILGRLLGELVGAGAFREEVQGLLTPQTPDGAQPAPSAATPADPKRPPPADLEIVPGGIVVHGHHVRIGGRPWAVIKAIASTRHRSMRIDDLMNEVWDDVMIAEVTVRDAVRKARGALRQAIAAARGREAAKANPLPNVDRGTRLTAWSIRLPE